MKFKCVIFDLDGTLADTIGDIAVSMNRALAVRGFPALSPEEYREKVGWGIKRLAFLALPLAVREGAGAGDLAEDLAVQAARFYAEEPLVHTRPYPGMTELLVDLKRRRLKLAVLTNKPDPVAQQVVEGLFPSCFDEVRGASPDFPSKPDPGAVWDLLFDLGCSPRQTLLAGDSEIDVETARNADCPMIACAWGFRSRQALIDAGAPRIDAGAPRIAGGPADILALVADTRI